ncbi:ribonuclease H-like domain-containing protein, partial [bacterium]|nr:ribonuclease H-like domain-containing protein [bacterium]
MRIKDRLRQIENTRLKSGSPVRSELRSDRACPDAYSPNISTTHKTSRGSVLIKQRDFSQEHCHGNVMIHDCLALRGSLLPFVAKDTTFSRIDIRQLLFLDTETTSLSGGAGACAFLIGLGYFTDEGFRITQLFMRDFGDEAAQLDQLRQIVADHPAMVTYNGKTFDVPLLQSRNVLHRVRATLDSLPHLDLLHAVRRHWKHKLPDCSLVTVEKQILRVDRV